ncbi:MAG: DUF5309 domain-containing protein [Clostridium sp.]|nr:DUF5309 domain-containing protein [Clostridium sp.]
MLKPILMAPETGADSADATAAAAFSTENIATETAGREISDELYSEYVDRNITKIRPMSTPLDNISRLSNRKVKVDSFVVKYYSVGSRPLKTDTPYGMSEMTTGQSVDLNVNDPSIFTVDDTIRVVGVPGVCDASGKPYPDDSVKPDLMLWVCGVNPTTQMPVVCAINGKCNTQGQPILIPQIPEGSTLVRMGKACGELDVQTGRYNSLPVPQEQYCQNFMIQIEQSTFDKLAAKEVDWNFSDLEADGIYDFRMGQENSYLFGVKNCIKHNSKKGMQTYFTGGIWNMAGKDIEVGTFDKTSGETVITEEDLVDITRDLFGGTDVGNKVKIMFCGSEMLAALGKIKSSRFILSKESFRKWNLEFKEYVTDFGTVRVIHHELFDENGMAECALAIDPEYLTKAVHIDWTRNVLDLKKAGIRNSDAVVIQEVSALYLRYPKAHARMRLARKQ